MEGARILAALRGQKVAIVRVISDEVTQDLPDLAPAIDNQGQLLPLLLARQMLIRPVPNLPFDSRFPKRFIRTNSGGAKVMRQ